MSDYKSYLLRQLGIKESRYKPSVDDPYKDIDPDELETGADEEAEEHGMSPEKAKQTAIDHLKEPQQGHYYTGVEKAKNMGMLKEKMPPFTSLLSPTAKSPAILAIGIRGTPGGIMPTSLAPSDTVSTPIESGVNVKSGAALGGLEPINTQRPNSLTFDTTPQNQTLNSSAPVADAVPSTPADEHPAQIQQVDGVPAQALAGSTNDAKAPMGEKPEPEKFEVGRKEGEEDISLKGACLKGIDVDVPKEEGEEESDEEEEEEKLHMVKEGKHKTGCQCGFCKNKGSFGKKKKEEKKNESADKKVDETFARHKKLMQEKLGIEPEDYEECDKTKINILPQKTSKKLTTERLKVLQEQFFKKAQRNPLTEQELEASKRILSILKARGVK